MTLRESSEDTLHAHFILLVLTFSWSMPAELYNTHNMFPVETGLKLHVYYSCFLWTYVGGKGLGKGEKRNSIRLVERSELGKDQNSKKKVRRENMMREAWSKREQWEGRGVRAKSKKVENGIMYDGRGEERVVE